MDSWQNFIETGGNSTRDGLGSGHSRCHDWQAQLGAVSTIDTIRNTECEVYFSHHMYLLPLLCCQPPIAGASGDAATEWLWENYILHGRSVSGGIMSKLL